MSRLVVGCPIRDRSWILPRWFEYLEPAVKRSGLSEPLLVFVGDTKADAETFAAATRGAFERHWPVVALHVDENLGGYERDWTFDRYRHMAMLRNTLLAEVRKRKPEYFWSLDSDILPAERALELALDGFQNRDFQAIGQRCYMTPGTWCPSYCNLVEGGGMLRYDQDDSLIPVDVIMASKVMTPAAYAVNYQPHVQGEDIGWSIAARAAGCKLGWDSRVTSKHVMERAALDELDPRCGF